MSESKDAPILLNEIREHYEIFDEARRLERADSQIEKLRTQELLHRYLPPPPGLILDIGGGAGVYAFWLAERGYQVLWWMASPGISHRQKKPRSN